MSVLGTVLIMDGCYHCSLVKAQLSKSTGGELIYITLRVTHGPLSGTEHERTLAIGTPPWPIMQMLCSGLVCTQDELIADPSRYLGRELFVVFGTYPFKGEDLNMIHAIKPVI